MASNVKSTTVTVSAQISSFPQNLYYGFSLRETTGAAVATARVRQGGASGPILDTIHLVAGESAREFYSPQGIHVNDTLYFEKVAGTIEGCVRHG